MVHLWHQSLKSAVYHAYDRAISKGQVPEWPETLFRIWK